jgi:hypothetical protein
MRRQACRCNSFQSPGFELCVPSDKVVAVFVEDKAGDAIIRTVSLAVYHCLKALEVANVPDLDGFVLNIAARSATLLVQTRQSIWHVARATTHT